MTKRCEQCREEYLPRQANQRFCSRTCSDEWHTSERRRAVEALRASTYFGRELMAAAESKDGVAQVGAVRFGEALPVPAHLHDPCVTEPPLGVDINEVPEEARR